MKKYRTLAGTDREVLFMAIVIYIAIVFICCYLEGTQKS